MMMVGGMVLCVVVALTLTPGLCATLLKRSDVEHHERRGFFGWFNRLFSASNSRYSSALGRMSGKPVRYLIVYVLIGGGGARLYMTFPWSCLPDGDQGFLMGSVSRPARTPAALPL